jgi:lysophospholipase L1-like esterase
MRASRRWFGKAVLAVLSLIFGLTVIEIALRILMPQLGVYTRPDDELGFAFIPGAEYDIEASEGCPGWVSRGRINAHGLRDYEYQYEPSPGVFRILALGDSYTEGFQFPLDRTWPKLIERHLNEQASGGSQYEVINAGRSGMGTGLEYLFFKLEGHKYRPQLVILLFTPNDFTDNSRFLRPLDQPYFVMAGDHLDLDRQFLLSREYRLRARIHWLKQRSYFVALASRAYTTMTLQSVDNGDFGVRNRGAGMSREEREAVEVTRHLLRQLNQAVEESGSRLLIIHGSSSRQVNWTRSGNGEGEGSERAAFETTRLLWRIAEKEGLTFLNLVPALGRHSTLHKALIHGCEGNGGEGHWNELGHALAAQLIHRYIVDHALLMGERASRR